MSDKTENNIRIVLKGWGKEIIFADTDKYCGKLLCLNNNCETSVHYHMKKDETWYLQSGEILLTYVDTDIGEWNEIILKEGDSFKINPGVPHGAKAILDSIIFEVSTLDTIEDNYRIRKGDSQKKGER